MADFKVQRGTATIAASGASVTITAGTDYTAPAAASKAFIRLTASNAQGCESTAVSISPDNVCASVTNPANLLTSITFSRGTASASTALHLDWEIVEYIGSAGGANEFIVREQEEVTYSGASNTANGTAATPTNDAKVAVFLTGQRGSAASALTYGDIYTTLAWDAVNHWAALTRHLFSGSYVASVSYVAVEFTGSNWTVQRVAHSYTAAGVQEDVTITDVGSLARAFGQGQINPAGSDNFEMSHQIWLSATNVVSFKLDSQATVTGADAVAWIVSNSQTGTGTANCNRYTGTYATSGTTNVTVTAVADLTQSSVWEISQTNTQNTGSPGRDQASHKLTTTTNCAVFHTGAAGTTTYRFAVFEWPTASGGGGGRTFFMQSGLDGHSIAGPKQFNPSLT